MSQSDYIKFKRIATILNAPQKLPPILNSGDYTDFLEYGIETTVKNDKTLYNEGIPDSNYVLLYNVPFKVDTCPDFTLCSGTGTGPTMRQNRKLVTTFYNSITGPQVTPISRYVKQPTYAKTACNCKRTSRYVDPSFTICKCKEGFYVDRSSYKNPNA